MANVRFFKMLIMMHLHFHTRSLKINSFKLLFWEGGGKKKYSVHAFDNVDNYGPLLSLWGDLCSPFRESTRIVVLQNTRCSLKSMDILLLMQISLKS